MAEQPENQSVVGEDGELLQADKTVDPDAYAEFVATYVHRDPLLFRLREHVKDWGCAYLFVIPFAVGFVGAFISLISLWEHDEETSLLGLLELIAIAAGVYWTLHRDNRQ